MDQQFWKQYTKVYDWCVSNLPGHQAMVQMHIDALQNAHKVLDSGSGPGYVALKLLEKDHEVHAIDINPEALRLLRERSGSAPKLFTYNQDVKNLPFNDNTFDGVSSGLVLWAMENPRAYLVEHNRVLRPRGTLVVSGPSLEVSANLEGYLDKTKQDLVRAGVFSQEKWDQLSQYVGRVAREPKEFSREEISNLLTSTGFEVVSVQGNPHYYGEGYVAVGRKI